MADELRLKVRVKPRAAKSRVLGPKPRHRYDAPPGKGVLRLQFFDVEQVLGPRGGHL